MDVSDSTDGALALHPTWTALGHRLAVIVGAGTALLALLRHVPVPTASLRGALAWLAVVALFRVGRALLEQARLPEAAPADGEEEPPTERVDESTPEGTRMKSPA